MFAITERLLLRPPWPEDAAALYDAANDARIVRNLARVPWPYRLADAQHYRASAFASVSEIAASESAASESAASAALDPLPHLLICDRLAARPRLLGACALDEDAGRIVLGYWIRTDSWNRGYASEAGTALLGIARALGHRRIGAHHFVDNPASGCVLRKIGFHDTGHIAPRWSEARGALMLSREFLWQDGAAVAQGTQRPVSPAAAPVV